MFPFGGKLVATSVGFRMPNQLHDFCAAVQHLNNLLVYPVDLFAPFGQAHRAVFPSITEAHGWAGYARKLEPYKTDSIVRCVIPATIRRTEWFQTLEGASTRGIVIGPAIKPAALSDKLSANLPASIQRFYLWRVVVGFRGRVATVHRR